MNLIKKVFIFIFSLFTVFALYTFRTVPSGKLWDSYTVVYVPVSVDDEVMQDGFTQYQIEEYVSLAKQRIPIMLTANSLEKTLFTLNINKQKSDYLSLRENYFFDSAKQYKLYYVHNDYKENVNQLIKALNKQGIAAGIDSSFSYPFILPLLTVLVALILLLFVKRKIFFILLELFPVFFAVTNPFYSCSISAIFILIAFFLLINLWGRNGAVSKLLHSFDFYVFVILSVVLAFANSWLSGVFALMVIGCDAGYLFWKKIKEDEILKKQTYTFINIRNARQVSIYGGKMKPVVLAATIAVAGVFAYFILNSSDSFNGQFAKVLLPGETTLTSKNLSNLEDFSKWTWDIKSLSYKSINKDNGSSKIVFPEYVKEDGKIKKIEITYSYDQDFKNQVMDSIDSLDFYSIEQVLKSQGTDASFGYTASSSYSVNIFTIIVMIISVCMLLFIDFSAIIRKGGKK